MSTGPKIVKGRGSSLPELSPDDPIYKRGFAIGVTRSTPSSKSTAATTSPSLKTPPEPSSNPTTPDDAAPTTRQRVSDSTVRSRRAMQKPHR